MLYRIIDSMIPIFVVVVMPVMIIWLMTRSRIKRSEQKMNVLMKAIENGVDIDPTLLMSETESIRNTKIKLINKLTIGIVSVIIGLTALICPFLSAFESTSGLEALYLGGGACLAIGVAYTSAFFIGRKFLAPEIEAEEKHLKK